MIYHDVILIFTPKKIYNIREYFLWPNLNTLVLTKS